MNIKKLSLILWLMVSYGGSSSCSYVLHEPGPKNSQDQQMHRKPLRSILKAEKLNYHGEVHPQRRTNNDRRVDFKSIADDGVVETVFNQLPAKIEQKTIVVPECVTPSCESHKGGSYTSLMGAPKSVALSESVPVTVEQYGAGWKGSPWRNHKKRSIRETFWDSSLDDKLAAMDAEANVLVDNKKLRDSKGQIYHPELGRLSFEPRANGWKWVDRYGHEFGIKRSWIVDNNMLQQEKLLVLSEDGIRWLRSFTQHLASLYDSISPEEGTVENIIPMYSPNSVTPEHPFPYECHRVFRTPDNQELVISENFFDPITHDLTEDARNALRMMHVLGLEEVVDSQSQSIIAPYKKEWYTWYKVR